MAQCSSQQEGFCNLKVCKVNVYKLPLGKKGKLKSIAKRTRPWKFTPESNQFETTFAQK